MIQSISSRRNIIDVHIHQPRPKGDEFLAAHESAARLIAEMDLGGVAISGILGQVAPGQSEAEVRQSIENTRAVVCSARDRLYGMVFVNPALPEEFIREQLDECLSSPHFRGIKLELDVNARDKRLDLLMEKAAEYGVPVLHHSWYLNLWSFSPTGLKKQENRSEPHDVADLARRFPGVTVIMAHMEGSGIRGILDIADLPNVLVDTSGALPFTGTLEFAIRELGSERILFGSDLMGRSLETQLGRIYGTPMSEDDLENILHRNAEKLFGINGTTLA